VLPKAPSIASAIAVSVGLAACGGATGKSSPADLAQLAKARACLGKQHAKSVSDTTHGLLTGTLPDHGQFVVAWYPTQQKATDQAQKRRGLLGTLAVSHGYLAAWPGAQYTSRDWATVVPCIDAS
jgi:hypothetical protein